MTSLSKNVAWLMLIICGTAAISSWTSCPSIAQAISSQPEAVVPGQAPLWLRVRIDPTYYAAPSYDLQLSKKAEEHQSATFCLKVNPRAPHLLLDDPRGPDPDPPATKTGTLTEEEILELRLQLGSQLWTLGSTAGCYPDADMIHVTVAEKGKRHEFCFGDPCSPEQERFAKALRDSPIGHLLGF